MSKEKYRVMVKKNHEENWQHMGKDFSEKDQALYCKEWLSAVASEYTYKVVVVEEIVKDL
jgi:hypothetical protein